jgi:hypothetical protein
MKLLYQQYRWHLVLALIAPLIVLAGVRWYMISTQEAVCYQLSRNGEIALIAILDRHSYHSDATLVFNTQTGAELGRIHGSLDARIATDGLRIAAGQPTTDSRQKIIVWGAEPGLPELESWLAPSNSDYKSFVFGNAGELIFLREDPDVEQVSQVVSASPTDPVIPPSLRDVMLVNSAGERIALYHVSRDEILWIPYQHPARDDSVIVRVDPRGMGGASSDHQFCVAGQSAFLEIDTKSGEILHQVNGNFYLTLDGQHVVREAAGTTVPKFELSTLADPERIIRTFDGYCPQLVFDRFIFASDLASDAGQVYDSQAESYINFPVPMRRAQAGSDCLVTETDTGQFYVTPFDGESFGASRLLWDARAGLSMWQTLFGVGLLVWCLSWIMLANRRWSRLPRLYPLADMICLFGVWVLMLCGWMVATGEHKSSVALWGLFALLSALFSLLVIWSVNAPRSWLGRLPYGIMLAAIVLLALRLATQDSTGTVNQPVSHAFAIAIWSVLLLVPIRARYGVLQNDHRNGKMEAASSAQTSIRQMILITSAIAFLIFSMRGIVYGLPASGYALNLIFSSLGYAMTSAIAVWLVFASRLGLISFAAAFILAMLPIVTHERFMILANTSTDWPHWTLHALVLANLILVTMGLLYCRSQNMRFKHGEVSAMSGANEEAPQVTLGNSRVSME